MEPRHFLNQADDLVVICCHAGFIFVVPFTFIDLHSGDWLVSSWASNRWSATGSAALGGNLV